MNYPMMLVHLADGENQVFIAVSHVVAVEPMDNDWENNVRSMIKLDDGNNYIVGEPVIEIVQRINRHSQDTPS
jgi:hypothetical protein